MPVGAILSVLVVLLLSGCTPGRPIVDHIEQAEISADGRSVTVQITHGACEDGHREAALVEQDDRVRVRVSGARAQDGPCVAIGVLEHFTVRLADPLGDRLLVDDSDGRVLQPVRR